MFSSGYHSSYLSHWEKLGIPTSQIRAYIKLLERRGSMKVKAFLNMFQCLRSGVARLVCVVLWLSLTSFEINCLQVVGRQIPSGNSHIPLFQTSSPIPLAKMVSP